jgi:hypothetical protein
MPLSSGTNSSYGGIGGVVDPVEGIAQQPMPAGVFRNLRCTASATPGGSGITVTVRSGTCGALGDSSQTVTLTTANVVATDTTHALTLTAGQCLAIKYTTNSTSTLAGVGCSMDFSPIGFLAFSSGMPLSTGANTTYASMVGDPVEGMVQMPSPGATYQNLRCTASAAPGGTGITATLRTGTCGSQSDSIASVTLTAANTVVTDTDQVVVTGGQCVDLKLVTGSTTALAGVTCTIERVL